MRYVGSGRCPERPPGPAEGQIGGKHEPLMISDGDNLPTAPVASMRVPLRDGDPWETSERYATFLCRFCGGAYTVIESPGDETFVRDTEDDE